jgi:hypothetical protein
MRIANYLHRTLVTALFAVSAMLLAKPGFAITGVWSGALNGAGGSETVTYKFSPRGNPILGFETRSGWQEIELTQVGQTKEWLLPGRGWARGKVDFLSVTPERVQVVVSIYRESGGGSLLDQSKRRLGLDFTQAGTSLKTIVVVESESHGSGSGVGLYAGSRGRQIYQGLLRRM